MNRLPYTTAIISVVIAVALWLVATWLEEESRWQLAEPSRGPGMNQGQVRPDTEVRVIPGTADCDRAEAALRVRIEDARYCSTDDDCTLFDYGYPIQCLTSVAKIEISSLRADFNNYEQSCQHRVFYDCPTGRMQRHAVCRSNICTVELQSNEALKDETLDYLGLDQR